MNDKPVTVKSASRVLNILEFVVNNTARRPTFTDILNQFSIPKSSLSYLLQELINQDYIKFEPFSKTYYPGIKLVRLSAACLNNSNIFEEIWLGIKQLSDSTGETSHAAVLSGRHITYIAKVQGKEDLGLVTIVGLRLPAHATAVGRVLLSALPEKEFDELMSGVKLERITENTQTDLAKLRQEIKQVAAQGYAMEIQESTVGAGCIAGPIYDSSNKLVAAISVTFLATIATEEKIADYIRRVTQATKSISQVLGFTGERK